jgi:hypothetical protein
LARISTALSAARTLARRVLPAPVYRAVWTLWNQTRGIRDWVTAFAMGIGFIATRSQRPRVLLYFGLSPGDDLLCTAVLREFRNRGKASLLMISNHKELFVGNADATYVQPVGGRYSTVPIYQQFARIWGGDFKKAVYAPFDGKDQSEPPSRHIVGDMCASAGIKGPISLRPYLTLTEDEKARAVWANDQIIIQSSGMGARQPMQNKQWYEERFQGVVDKLHDEFQFIQVGAVADPAIRHAKDLRGTTSIRESAAILHHARLYVGTIGFLMHLARAVECPSVIVYGGREAPWQSGYICNINLYSAVPCAPCWRWNSCDFDRRCMREIVVEDVVLAIRQMLEKPRNPLAVEIVEIE